MSVISCHIAHIFFCLTTSPTNNRNKEIKKYYLKGIYRVNFEL